MQAARTGSGGYLRNHTPALGAAPSPSVRRSGIPVSVPGKYTGFGARGGIA